MFIRVPDEQYESAVERRRRRTAAVLGCLLFCVIYVCVYAASEF